MYGLVVALNVNVMLSPSHLGPNISVSFWEDLDGSCTRLPYRFTALPRGVFYVHSTRVHTVPGSTCTSVCTAYANPVSVHQIFLCHSHRCVCVCVCVLACLRACLLACLLARLGTRPLPPWERTSLVVDLALTATIVVGCACHAT